MLPRVSKQPTFGQMIRELRKAQNLTQRELADRVAARLKAEDRRGFDFTYLSKIENDKTPPPSIPVIIVLAHELDGDKHELISLAGKVSPELGRTLKESEGARIFYRSALNADLTEADWAKLVQTLKRRTAQRENSPEPGD
ncbi:MAG: helix-turn-helix domain-containing protein [Planctomycetes bacterium]|nr:helix-turn-helix domain-containing protein [Planctomycetota bacterium]